VQIYARKFKGWRGFKYGMKKITDPSKLKKLSRLAKIKMKNLLSKGT
jgi:hypothetical protein